VQEIYAFDCLFSDEIEQPHLETTDLGAFFKHPEFENSQPEVFRTE